ncbi:PHD finger protein 20 isoform X4 [Syngnathus typhle]|uniref:PHD finger protein 20 isoform X4 n=1 Tax=Syngnathus typhle TaxID=161592 RepID=UPI002A69EE6B|nr:PHD finger protein 20 isoform X4 [Syngnathus typhle]
MSKTPPNRRGITFEVGAQLEARDSLKNWYAANIEKIDYDDEKVLIHYRQWSHRYDEWFEWTSPYLRPVERVSLRRQGLQDDAPVPGFQVNDKVLASWSDCRFYPAKVISVNKDVSYTVKFFDGVIQTVKGIHVKPFIKERGAGKSRSSERNMVRRVPNRKDRRPPVNGESRNKRARRSTSDQENDSNSEEEEREVRMVNGKSKRANGKMEASPTLKQAEGKSGQSEQKKPAAAEDGGSLLTNGAKDSHDDKCHENGDVKQEEEEVEMEAKPHSDSAKPYTEVPDQPEQTAAQSNGDLEQKPNVKSERLQPDVTSPPQPVKPVRKQGFHNPNRFSREPLYRVIKNQPPPVLSINLDHNPFKCSVAGCAKSFRKAKLLHYHMKYYHGEEQPPEAECSPTRSSHGRSAEKQATCGALDGPKRRRTVSASMHSVAAAAATRGEVKAAGRRTSAPSAVGTHGHQQRVLLREKSKENQLGSNGCQPHDQDSDKRGFDGDDDSFSDWSTDSCGWSDEDYGLDVDVTSPPLSMDCGADGNDQEIVRCICEVEEENDFMIQCEDCLCWQHGTCMGLLEDNVPDRYACYICRDPPGQRQSLRYWYDREWLSNGHMYGLSFLEENYSHQNAKKITTTHQLLGDVHHVVEILNGLQLKMNILQNNTHPDLKLWRQPWKRVARPPTCSDSYRGSNAAPSPVSPDEDMSRGEILMSNALEKLSRAAASASSSSSSSFPFPSFQDSYIISEHCYQKPRAYYPAVEQRLVVETRQGSELEDSMRSTEELLEREQRFGGLLETDKPKSISMSNKAPSGGSWPGVEIKSEVWSHPEESSDNCKTQQQWQLNLLDHIDAVQDEVSHRMDFIERELDVLESWLDYTGELEPPEPLARLPQLKHRMKRLMSQLGKVHQLTLLSST